MTAPRSPDELPTTDDNRDPLTAAPGAHPVGTGLGASGAGMTGAAIGGVVAGPIGAIVGAAVGALAGGLAGHEIAERVNPTADVDELGDGKPSAGERTR